MAIRQISTVCPRNCYSTCSFRVQVEDGRITGYTAQPANRATPEGMCLKGQSYIERVYAGDRILYPLKKETSGTFKRISWPEALREIAGKMMIYKKQYGPLSIFFYSSSGSSGIVNDFSLAFWQLFGGATISYGNLCWPAGLEATRLTLGDNRHNVPWDLENARLILMWGKNAAETNVHEMVFIRKAQDQGAKLVVIDPRRTLTAEKADLLIQPRPGTDGTLALGIARYLIENDLVDHEFIQKNVKGYEAFKASLTPYTPDHVSRLTGIPVNYVMKLAGMIGEIRPMTLFPGYGMQRYTNGGQTIRCLLSLSVITGNIGKPEDWLKQQLGKYPELSWDKLSGEPVIAPEAEEIAFADGHFPTASGKIKLFSEKLAGLWGVNPLPSFDPPEEVPEKSEYSLYLLTPNTKNRIHSQFGNLRVIRQVDPRPVAGINPEDARRRGIGNGDRIRIYNSRGELKVRCRYDYGLLPGCVVLPNGYWISEGGGVNLLSAPRETDMGHGTAFHDNLVEIEKTI